MFLEGGLSKNGIVSENFMTQRRHFFQKRRSVASIWEHQYCDYDVAFSGKGSNLGEGRHVHIALWTSYCFQTMISKSSYSEMKNGYEYLEGSQDVYLEKKAFRHWIFIPALTSLLISQAYLNPD